MRRFCAFLLASLICFIPGCVLGVGWLPDSSGFVFTTPKGQLLAYDLATKTQRIVLEDPAATATSWPAVSPQGRIALAQLGSPDDKDAFLEIVVCDLKGQVEFRSEKFKLATLKGTHFQYSTQVVWSPDEKKLLVYSVGQANSGVGFEYAALVEVGTNQIQVWEDHVPAYFGGSPVRPDGAGFLLTHRKGDVSEYAWVDWTGKLEPIIARNKLYAGALMDSHWDGDKAILNFTGPTLTMNGQCVIDTEKLQATVEKERLADVMIGEDRIIMRAQLASGIELFLLLHYDPEKKQLLNRVVSRQPGDPTLTDVVAPIYDHMVLLSASPDRKHAIVRAWRGHRGKKADTIYILNEAGQLHDTVEVVGN